MAKIRANIYDKAYVPSLGRGPFMNKVIHEELFRSLKRLGYLVENADEEVSDRLIFDEVDEGFLIDGEGTTTPESPAGGGEGTQQPEPPKAEAGNEQPEPPKDETVVSPEPPKADTDSGTEQPPQTDDNESAEHPKDEAGTEQQPSVGGGDSVQTPNTDGPKVDENEAPKADTVEEPKVETTEEPKVDAEDKKAVENKVQLTDDEVKFLTGNARRQEIIDLLTEKGVHIENENATIAELLNLVGLTRN